MPTSESPAAFEVVIVPFPYSDRLAEKRRPALVISNPALRPFGLLWVAMITSSNNPRWSCDIPIVDLKRAGLPAASVVRVAKIACIEPSRVIGRAGQLDKTTARKIAARVRHFLG